MSTTVTGVEEKPQEIPASMWDKLKAALGLSDAQVSHAQASFSKTPREIELEAEIARRDAAAFTAQQGQRDAQATALAEALLKEHRIKPYQLEAVKAEFARALDDDARAPLTVNFSTEATATEQAKTVAMSRTDRLKELYAQLPADEVGTEQVREFGQETYAAFTQEATRMRNAGDEDKVDFAEVNKARAEMGLEPLQAV